MTKHIAAMVAASLFLCVLFQLIAAKTHMQQTIERGAALDQQRIELLSFHPYWLRWCNECQDTTPCEFHNSFYRGTCLACQSDWTKPKPAKKRVAPPSAWPDRIAMKGAKR